MKELQALLITLGLFGAAYLLAPPGPSPPTPPTTTIPSGTTVPYTTPATPPPTFPPSTPVTPPPTALPTPMPTRSGIKPACLNMSMVRWRGLYRWVPMNGTSGLFSWVFGSGTSGVLMNSYDNATCLKLPGNTRISDSGSNPWSSRYGCDGYCWMLAIDNQNRVIPNATLAANLAACLAVNKTGEYCCDKCGPAPHEVEDWSIAYSQYCGSKLCGPYTPPGPVPTAAQPKSVHWWTGCFSCDIDSGVPPDIPAVPTPPPPPACFHNNMTKNNAYDPGIVFPLFQIPSASVATQICISQGIERYYQANNFGPDGPVLARPVTHDYGEWVSYYPPIGANDLDAYVLWLQNTTLKGPLDCTSTLNNLLADANDVSGLQNLQNRWSSFGNPATSGARVYGAIVDYDIARKDAYGQPDYMPSCANVMNTWPQPTSHMDAHSAYEFGDPNAGGNIRGHWDESYQPTYTCTWGYDVWGLKNPAANGYYVPNPQCSIPVKVNVDQTGNMFNENYQRKPDQSWGAIPGMYSKVTSNTDAWVVFQVACAVAVISDSLGPPTVGTVSVAQSYGAFCPKCWCYGNGGGKPNCNCPVVAPTPTPGPTPLPPTALYRPRVPEPARRDPGEGPRYNQPPDPPFFFRAARFVEKKTGLWSWVNDLHK